MKVTTPTRISPCAPWPAASMYGSIGASGKSGPWRLGFESKGSNRKAAPYMCLLF